MDKAKAKSPVRRRRPTQDRSHQKVELILEAAIRLLERGAMDKLTTNAIAEKAGVSIGTVYQYFRNKDAVLNALADREIAALSEKVMDALKGIPPKAIGGRIGIIIQTVLSTYGGRRRAHRLLIEYALTSRTPSRLSFLLGEVVEMSRFPGAAPARFRRPMPSC